MRVTVRYFAAARERAGLSTEALEVPDGATAAQVRDAACALHPALSGIASKLRVAVDQEFAADGSVVREGAEVALIPPVAGGSGRHRIGAAPLSADAPLEAVRGPDCGAVVSFVGTVRGENRGKPVVALEYEAYDEMALRTFARIEEEARAQWPGTRLAIHHRTGTLGPGDLSVVIAAAAPHRADAFSACRHAIEALKKDAPIWKRERYPDGSEWVGLGS